MHRLRLKGTGGLSPKTLSIRPPIFREAKYKLVFSRNLGFVTFPRKRSFGNLVRKIFGPSPKLGAKSPPMQSEESLTILEETSSEGGFPKRGRSDVTL